LDHDGTISELVGGGTRLGRVFIGNNCYIGEDTHFLLRGGGPK